MSALHAKYGDYIIACAKAASQTGAPMVRAMEYAYPHCGYGGITDQYLLGDRILVAPVLKKGQRRRKVRIPTGKWRLVSFGGICRFFRQRDIMQCLCEMKKSVSSGTVRFLLFHTDDRVSFC